MTNQKSNIKTFYFSILVFIFAILFFIFNLPLVSAQTQKGISVTPSIMHLDLAEDPPQYSITYKNTTQGEITLALSAKDFDELEESYKINFLEGQDAANYRYSLSSWISFEHKTIQLAPNEEKSVRIFIDKDRITKGGHYASILAEIEQPDEKKQVSVRAILSSLLFVRASTGQEIEKGKILSLRPLRNWLEYPESFTWRFENSGNVHVVPYGLIEVYDSLGNLVSKGILNEDSLDALPESIRTYRTKVTTYQNFLIPAVYTAKISAHFGKQNLKADFLVKFFSWGSFDFVKIALILIIITVVSFYFRKFILSTLRTKLQSK